MKTIKFTIQAVIVLLISINTIKAQPRIKVLSGQITLNDFAPTESKYRPVSDSLDHTLKLNPNDTTALFYRAVLYLSFNNLKAKSDLTAKEPVYNLLTAKRMADRADSLNMKNFDLKILRAQICKELTYHYAPADTWRFSAEQMAARKKTFDHYKTLANRYYDELTVLDKANAYDYQRLKIK